MKFSTGHTERQNDISELFSVTFSASEGAADGKIVSELAAGLMATTPNEDLFVFSAYEDGSLAGCIFLSRLTYNKDDRQVFILSPVAVTPDRQREGIGQELITFALAELRKKGIDLVMTYGDPNYYSKVGFRQITEDFAQAPFTLTQPEGWLAQSLSPDVTRPLKGPCQCVGALNKKELW